MAEKGDILCWHANLVHGGTKIERPGSTRRSIVGHYLTQEINEYYDINYADGVRMSAQQAAHNALAVTPDLKKKH
jgi:ectoine hydroxylase-related dioxygenase (phytanoyl-CoA dioxygenase family)